MPSNALITELRKTSPHISVGILTSDLMSLGSQLEFLENAGVKLLHIDVMDGCFCPMMTVGPPFIKAVRTSLLKDVHLMIDEPIGKLESYVAAGADMITISLESCHHIHRALQTLGQMTNINDSDRGILRGVGLNPGTPLEAVTPLVDEIEMVYLLAVNPGWGGQKLVGAIPHRVARLKEMIREAQKDILIAVDGGIKRDNIAYVARLGADIIVTGSAVFDGQKPAENLKFMLEAVKQSFA